MGHHVPASLPPIAMPIAKLEKPRWRPRLRKTGMGEAGGVVSADESEEAFATPPLASVGSRPHSPNQDSHDSPVLNDEVLRVCLAVQESGLEETIETIETTG